MDLNSFETVQRWFRTVRMGRTGSEETIRVYSHFLSRFCDFTKKDPDKLIAERKQDIKSEDETVKRRHEELLMTFIEDLEKTRKLSRKSIVLAHGAIRSFFKANYLPLMSKTPESWVERISKVPTREELRKMCEVSDTRDKAIILTLAQSGMSLEDYLALTFKTSSPQYGSIWKQLKEGRNPIHLHIIREKRKVWYDTFWARNSINALNTYVKEYELGLSDPLFDLSDRSIERIIKNAGIRAKFEAPVYPHSLRKFFNTYLKLAGVNETVVEYMMGHKLGGVRGAYFVPPVEELEKIYIKAEPYISITTEVTI